jgi:hypothetical protein
MEPDEEAMQIFVEIYRRLRSQTYPTRRRHTYLTASGAGEPVQDDLADQRVISFGYMLLREQQRACVRVEGPDPIRQMDRTYVCPALPAMLTTWCSPCLCRALSARFQEALP